MDTDTATGVTIQMRMNTNPQQSCFHLRMVDSSKEIEEEELASSTSVVDVSLIRATSGPSGMLSTLVVSR
jgi:aromatic ring hydroxylase